jgi:DNA polymerase III epsilon subunit-like protein
MKPAIMIDLETLGQAPGCAIASIGAVKFDPHSDWIGDLFHIHISLESCQQHGLSMDASTVLWWLQQDEQARVTLLSGQSNATNLITALDAFEGYFGGGEAIWCNGASFDFPILTAAYKAINHQAPWLYWHEHDLRTLKNLNKGQRIERHGTHHNALDDAIHQARLVQHILQANPDMDA